MANDFQATGVEIVAGPSACTEGEIISATVRVKFEDGGGANERYNIGFFVGEFGEPAIDGASCAFDSLQPVGGAPNLTGGSGPFLELNGDACGDISKSDPTYKDIQVDNLACRDADGDGQLDVSAVLSWVNNGNQANCQDPLDPAEFLPDPPKCLSVPEFDLPIVVEPPPGIDVSKVAVPDALPEPGGQVSYVVTVVNTSPAVTDPVTIDSIVDDPWGDVTSQTDCVLPFTLAPGESRSCTVVIDVAGQAGQVIPDTVTVSGSDDEGTPVTGSASAEVRITQPVSPFLVPRLHVGKFASPSSVSEPGGEVTYTLLVTNSGPLTAIELTGLNDDLYGNLDGKGNCALPQVLSGTHPFYLCSFSETVSGAPGSVVTDVVVATGVADTPGRGVVAGLDTASVTITDVPSAISLAKSAVPADLAEPGGEVSFTLQVQNNSVTDAVTINHLLDSQLGVPAGDCVTPFTLAPGGDTYSCTYSGLVSGKEGDFVTNVVVATGRDDDDGIVAGFAAATVSISGLPPSLELTKLALPPAALGSGSPVLYLVAVHNTSGEGDPVTLTSLTDDIYGNLDGQGSCSLPQLVQPGAFYLCTFTIDPVAGTPGSSLTDTITVAGVDDEGEPATASDTATVQFFDGSLPRAVQLVLHKVATPVALPEPGGEVTYHVIVANSADPGALAANITIDSVHDDLYGDLATLGDCAALVGITLAPKAFASCSFTEQVNGAPGDVITDTILAVGRDVLDLSAQAFDSARVTITDVPSALGVSKTASPTSVTEPGAEVAFRVVVRNLSRVDAISLQSLVDNVHGDLVAQSGCPPLPTLQPGDSYLCEFTAFVGGMPGDQELNTVTAAGTDDDGNPVQAAAQASVAVLDSPPLLLLDKQASPPSLQPEGGTVSYRYTVQNQSAVDAVSVDTMVDSVLGDLAGQGSCTLPQPLAAGGSYTCLVNVPMSGTAGETRYNSALATGTSDDGDPVSAQDSAIVRFLAVALPGIPAIGVAGLAVLLSLVSLLAARAVRRRPRAG